MSLQIPTDYLENLKKLGSGRAFDKYTGIDERLDYQNIVMTDLVNMLKRVFGGGMPNRLQQQQQILPPYNLTKLLLDTATTDKEIKIPGDYLAFYTDGSYLGIGYKIDDSTHDAISALEYGYYVGHFEAVYVTWTAQAGKYLRVFVGRGEQYRYWG